MDNTTAKKLKRTGSSHSEKMIRIITPGFFGLQRLTSTQRIVFNALFSFTQWNGAADFTLGELVDHYNLSYASAYRSIKSALVSFFKRSETKAHAFERTANDVRRDLHYFYIEDWLRFAHFWDPDKKKLTTLSFVEVELTAYIIHQNRKIKNWTCTQNRIARVLGISTSTVSIACRHLKRLGILTKEEKNAVNLYTRRPFILDAKLLNEKKTETITRAKALSKDARDINARNARKAFYERRKAEAEKQPERVRNELGELFKKLEREIVVLEHEAAVAQKNREMQRIREIMERRLAIRREMQKMLEAHGYTFEDLEPRYHCPKCKDTGWLPNGLPCDCYIPPTGGTA